MAEQWRIVGQSVSGRVYEVSDYGNLRSNGRPLKAWITPKGYMRSGVCGRHQLVHRLVAQAFIPNPFGHPMINHIDSNRRNNHVSNLEWCTAKHNAQHTIRAGRFNSGNRIPVVAIHPDGTAKEYQSQAAAGADGFNFRLVSACILGKARTHRGARFVLASDYQTKESSHD